MVNKASGSESLRLGENIKCRSAHFVILRFGVQSSIFDLQSFRAGEPNSFDKAVSTRQDTGCHPSTYRAFGKAQG
jgi:hypothetical protein